MAFAPDFLPLSLPASYLSVGTLHKFDTDGVVDIVDGNVEVLVEGDERAPSPQ